MNIYEFEAKMVKKHGSKLNVIFAGARGFVVTTFSDKKIKIDAKGGKRIWYKTISSLRKNSKSFAKSYNTILVEMTSNDYAKAKITKITL